MVAGRAESRSYVEDLAAVVVEEISAANGGRLPATSGELAGLVARFGGRLCWLGADLLPAPFVRRGVVYMPDVRPHGGRLVAWLAHELAEVVLVWEGREPYQGPGLSGDRHRIAGLVERRFVAAAAAREH